MSPQSVLGSQGGRGPRFYVTPKRRMGVGPVLLALVIALGVLVPILHALSHARSVAGAEGDDDDDPSRVDTIYLGGPGQAPVATRPAAHPSTVHPFVVVHLPRDGDGTGQIPDTPAGRLLYAWLAAFNGTDPTALGRALPTSVGVATQAAQWELRKKTGGFTLLSAKEIEPGILVFRLHDQSPQATEVLGTLTASPNATPMHIASLSLRAVPTQQPQAGKPGS